MTHMDAYDSREEWLEHRKLGGSDAAAILGISPWMSNLDLWRLKTGRLKPKNLDDDPLVLYGTKAEEHLRELFALDFPELVVGYVPFNIWTNDRYPFAHASLDGWVLDEKDRFGVLEIKTATITSQAQKAKWEGKIPDYYYTQLLWNMAVTDAEFSILVAQLKWERDGDVFKVTKHYELSRDQAEADIIRIMEAGEKFAKCIKEDREPAITLPEIGRRFR